MIDAGYGNHDADKPGSAVAERPIPATAAETRSGEAAPSPKTTDDGRRKVATPGEGAGPGVPQGKDVDPGVG